MCWVLPWEYSHPEGCIIQSAIYGMYLQISYTNNNTFIISLTLLYEEDPFARSWPPSRRWRWSAAPLPPSGPCGGRRLRGLIIKQHVLKFVLHVTPLFNITKITRPHAFMHEQPAARETQTIWKLILSSIFTLLVLPFDLFLCLFLRCLGTIRFSSHPGVCERYIQT